MTFRTGDRVIHERLGPGVVVPKTHGTVPELLCVLLDGRDKPRRVNSTYLRLEEKNLNGEKMYVLNLVDHVHGRERFQDLSVEPPDDRSLTPQLDLPTQAWRDMGMPVELKIVVTRQDPGESAFKDPAALFEQ